MWKDLFSGYIGSEELGKEAVADVVSSVSTIRSAKMMGLFRKKGRWEIRMRKNSFGQGLLAVFVVIGIMAVIGAIGEASEPKCIKSGCDNKQAPNSSYCYLHKPYIGSSSSHSSSSYSRKSSSSSSGKTSTSTSGSSSKNSTSSSYSNKSSSGSSSSYSGSNSKKSNSNKSSTKKSSSYKSYDDGYDDIYMDGDYDEKRYKTDKDYADGVDDAMDEFEEDW